MPYKFNIALLGGRRAFPPEDCGAGGYERCVEFQRTGFEEYDEGTLGPWLDTWQPEQFDLARMKKTFDK